MTLKEMNSARVGYFIGIVGMFGTWTFNSVVPLIASIAVLWIWFTAAKDRPTKYTNCTNCTNQRR